MPDMQGAQLTWLCFAVFASSSGTTVHGQEIRIRVLDGRNGRPITKECVNVWVGPSGASTVIPTNKDGEAVLRLVEKNADTGIKQYAPGCHGFAILNPVFTYADTISIAPVDYVSCQAHPPGSPLLTFSTEKVLQSGDFTDNKCGKVEASPKPGELIFFVRPRTWLEWLRI